MKEKCGFDRKMVKMKATEKWNVCNDMRESERSLCKWLGDLKKAHGSGGNNSGKTLKDRWKRITDKCHLPASCWHQCRDSQKGREEIAGANGKWLKTLHPS